MQLFSPKQATKSFANKQAVDTAKIAYLETTLKGLQERINTENTEFDKRMQEQRELYADEKMRLQTEVRVLENELKAKRRERQALMLPVDDLKQQAEVMLRDLNKQRVKIMDREEVLEEKIAELSTQLNELANRESEIAEKEADLMEKLRGVDEESEVVSKGHKNLNEMLLKFKDEVSTKTKELADSGKALEIREKLMAKHYVEMDKSLSKREKAVKDRAEALERGFKELKKLKANKK